MEALHGVTDARAEAAAVARAAPARLLIGGTWRDARGGRRFGVHDPATTEVVAEVADAAPADALAALDAAVAAGPAWAATAPRDRAAVLRGAADLLQERREALALLLTLENGKPLPEARGEVDYAAAFLRFYGEEATRLPGSLGTAPGGGRLMAVTTEPVGPCVLVTPWNFPAAMPARKLAPALAAGCTAVLKPSELTPLSAAALVAVLEEAGLPAGAANLVPTTDAAGVVGPLLADPRTRKLSFTGSTPVGKRLMAQAAENVLALSLELGGNAPLVVCADADLDVAVRGAMDAKFRNGGQACTAANRLYVEAGVADAFLERFTAAAVALRPGHGLDPGTDLGPLINAAAREKARSVVVTAIADGARPVTGTVPDDLPGAFCAPTVLLDVPAGSAALREEVFAPVAPVVTVADPATALRLANDTPFGLAAYVFTRDLDRARHLSAGLRSGMVGLNTGLLSDAAAPFGGVGWSGTGREGGAAGLEAYLERKYVAVA